MLARARHTARLTTGRLVHRCAGQKLEYLVERGFVKSYDGKGDPTLAVVLRDPRPLEAGKSTWNMLTACLVFFRTCALWGTQGRI